MEMMLKSIIWGHLRIIDNTEEIISGYQVRSTVSSLSDLESDRDEGQTLAEESTTPIRTVRTERSLDNEFTIESLLTPVQSRDIIHHNDQATPSHDDQSLAQFAAGPSTYTLPFSLGQAVSQNASPLPEPSIPVTATESANLISLYLYETGTWCETTDSERPFTIQSIHQMLDSKPFLASAIALASRQRDAVHGQQSSMTLELYQYTIQLLLRQEPGTAGVPVLAACTLLCVYEMMASCVWEWRRHLKGCASLLHNRKWNGSCSGIVKCCFWAFARIDVWAAFISGQTTLIPTDSWVDDSSISSVAAKGNIDDYCNLAILIFAQIVNLLGHAGPDDKEHDPFFNFSVARLWGELQDWWQLRPRELRYFKANILINEKDQIWHARELGGISVSNVSQASFVGDARKQSHWASTPSRSPWDRQIPTTSLDGAEEFASEKIALLKQLARIEHDTGWKTSDRASDLRKLWGLG
ncbi:Zn(II)2Cys6 transcription factor [Penicillium angulare]|uniref:Zn(II)2Cys6 transcription factor n=1 Tax=Penicillium angulare TaxID=116970 RepID=A0A9W9ESS3_9EURO|nr:Zn(II)2Cys6 transcription factor [Penicillium angulare]